MKIICGMTLMGMKTKDFFQMIGVKAIGMPAKANRAHWHGHASREGNKSTL